MCNCQHAMGIGSEPITYPQVTPSGAIPPGQDRQFRQSTPGNFYLVQVPGPGAVATQHVASWYHGPYAGSGYSPVLPATPKVFQSGPPLDPRMYDLPLTTAYGSGVLNGC
jgi:hypothetical protein